MLDSDWVDSCFVPCGQVQVFLLQKTLVYECLFDILVVEVEFKWVFEQVLVEVLHDAVLDALAVQLHLFLTVALAHREELCELVQHVSHEFLHVLALLLALHVWLDDLREDGLHKLFDLLPDGQCFVTFQFVVEVVEDALLRLLLLRLQNGWFLPVFVRIV